MKKILIFVMVSATYFSVYLAGRCNEAVCSSIVSKCLLIKSCMCTPENYTCHRNCYTCLGNYHSECCSCLDICLKSDNKTNNMSKQSHVEAFPEAIPGLFKALTETPDELSRWKSITFPIQIDINQYTPKTQTKYKIQSAETQSNVATLNCTVVFMPQCMSWNKCRQNCHTMGASSYRWFHDGCCECVGENCIYYGIDESRCENCPVKLKKIDDNDLEYEDEYDDEEDYDDY